MSSPVAPLKKCLPPWFAYGRKNQIATRLESSVVTISSRNPGCPRFSNSNSVYRRLSSDSVRLLRCRPARETDATAPRGSAERPGSVLHGDPMIRAHHRPRSREPVCRSRTLRILRQRIAGDRQHAERRREAQRDQPRHHRRQHVGRERTSRPCPHMPITSRSAGVDVDHLNEKAEGISDQAGCEHEQRNGENGDGRRREASPHSWSGGRHR